MPKNKRQKHAKKTLMFYRSNFGVEAPYKVLIDGTFCKEALKLKVNIWEQLPKYLDAEVKLLTTRCAKAECEQLGATPELPLYGAYKVISQYSIEACDHDPPMDPSLCLLKMAKKKKHYFIATQEKKLSEKLREVPGTPLLYIAYNCINIEPPSASSEKSVNKNLKNKLKIDDNEMKNLDILRKAAFGEETPVVIKKKRKIKNPNPLSCLKKKKKLVNHQPTNNSDDANKRKRKRKHNKVIPILPIPMETS